jgi:glycosyltransferase involved in cell wall biosynthesis
MIEGYVARDRDLGFVCVGNLQPKVNSYHARVRAAARGRVIFPGAIYDPHVLRALRFHAAAYCHGHSVGGTNPSLVEALAAGNAVIAHDNPYNRWVAGQAQLYFAGAEACARALDTIAADEKVRCATDSGGISRLVRATCSAGRH